MSGDGPWRAGLTTSPDAVVSDVKAEHQPPANAASLEDVPPDGGYGWVCTFCVFIINANTWGVNSSWGIFLDRYMTRESFRGATKFEYAMIGGLSISQALLISPLAQAMSLLPPWFSRHRSLAVGFATSGAGLGGLAYSLLAGRLIEVSGLAWTWRILSFTRYSFSVRDFLRIQIFLILCWGFLTEFGYVALWYSLPSYATSVGLSPTQGSIVQALLSLGLGLGRPVVGYYSDRVGRINMALCMTALCGVLCLTLWILARNYAGLLAFALIGGVMSGTFWSTVNPILAEVVGIAESGSTFAAICFALVLPTTFGEAIALQLVKGEGIHQFLPSQIFVGFMFLAGAIFLWFLRSWKIFEIERKAEDEQRSVLADMEVAAIRGVRSSFWLTPKRLFMPRRV
ncbi:hypothetical protein N0V88_005145 [Collariella sp. IMI 366227]|nr:hypothetical protein N0V88_005145 [Collariella sp. IMI 366227]